MRVALFAGSFDPFTRGHESIVRRGLDLFDKVIVAIGINSAKKPLLSDQARKEWIEAVFQGEDRVEVITYSGLTVDAATQCGAQFLLRGVRTATDFEYEQTIAITNRSLAGIETVLINTLPQLSHISSSLVRELLSHGHDVSQLIPQSAPIELLSTHQ